ncbi:MAG: hypothetical protein KDA91_16220, partial [Planctomycetaceae bacterium]|nr:hypothetical protein [Planctomycetaceae bacterium]
IVFFDRTEDVKSNAILKRLKDVYPVLKSNRIIVCAITNLLPQQVRAGDASQLPFPVLSDVASGQMDSPTVAWGRAAEEPVVSDQSAGIAGGVFYIDRLGLVDWNGNAPRPVDNPQHMINALITGEIQ